MAGTKYLKTEGALTYTALNINSLDAENQQAIRESDRHTVNADGTISFTDSDGSEQLVPVSTSNATVDLSNISSDVLQKAADISYLAQNTGVLTSDMNAVYTSLGIDPNDTQAHVIKDAILKSAGYNPGEQAAFYGNNSAVDVGAQILSERWQNAPTAEEIEAAGLDPNEVSVVNSNAANAFYLEQELANRGINSNQTAGRIGSGAGFGGGNLSPLGMTGATSVEDVRTLHDANKAQYGADNPNFLTSDQQLDMFEWDLLKKKEEESTGTSTTPAATGLTPSGAVGTGGSGGVSGGFTTSSGGYNIPASGITPGLTPSLVSSGASGTYQVPAQTFNQNITDQVTDFQGRDQSQYFQPQTMAEKQAAGQDTAAYAISQKLYRNPNTGHQLFIAFQGEQPLAPIPAGYYEVNQSTGTFGQSSNVFNPVTAGGNTFTAAGASQGMYVQGFDGAGYVEGHTSHPDGTPHTPEEEGSGVVNPFDPSNIYGTTSFTDPVTGQVVTQDPYEYQQTKLNKVAQATINPATAVTMPGVSTMAELGYVYNTDGSIKTDPATGQPMTKELMPGTVLESTAGQASGLAPVIGKRQATDAEGKLLFGADGQPVMVGADIAQVTGVTQAKGPGQAAVYDAEGNLVSAEVPVPGTSTAGLTTATGDISRTLEGGTTTDYTGMAASVEGATWDAATGTFKVGDQNLTPDQFIAANNINVGDYMTTTGGLQAVTSTGPTKTIDAAKMQKQKVDPVTGQPMFTVDAEGNQVPVMESATSVSGIDAATGTATEVGVRQKADPETGELMFDAQGNPIMERVLPKRTLQEQVVDPVTGEVIQQGELISGTGVDQTKVDAAFGTGEVAAASVQDELSGLMAQFEGGDTPAWAAGSMRKATQMLAARGLGASSLAGQAVIQAAMEAALPIAQIDAGNKQQMALFKAEQRSKFLGMEFDQAFQAKVMNASRVSEIANMNFNAEQQVALENSRAANTMNLANLSNKQAKVMAEAAALSQMDMANLSNEQQARIQNAQNFLQIDMANMSNEQSTALFKAQSVTNSMLSDVAQANATAQFNATSENQATQFFSNLSAQVSQFNAAQQNAINQFNAEEANSVLEFNAALQNQREMFNAQNYLVVAQANAKWRQDINTSNTAAQNVANLTYAKEVNNLTNKALDDFWQKERDTMSYIFAQSESAMDRSLKVLLGDQSMEELREQLGFLNDRAKSSFFSRLILGDASVTDIFKLTQTTADED